jgi:hypothetical protein
LRHGRFSLFLLVLRPRERRGAGSIVRPLTLATAYTGPQRLDGVAVPLVKASDRRKTPAASRIEPPVVYFITLNLAGIR